MVLSVMENKNFIHKVAITGIIGSGKSTVGLILRKKRLNFISADELAKEAIAPESPGYFKMLKLLGPEYLKKKGGFNTQKIASAAFQNRSLLNRIELIIHPIVWDLMQKRNKKLLFSGKKIAFYEIPLLFEKSWENFFHTRIVIATDPEKQKSRLKKYRAFTNKEIDSRMQFQICQEEKIKKADYVIWNNSSIQELEKQILNLVNSLKVI